MPPPEGLAAGAWDTAAVALLMAVWWITEALPIPATALLPIVLLPLFDVASVADATSPYANPLIFLFMGGFVIAIAMERWNLHRRIALNIVSFVGTRPSSIIIGFIIAGAFLSMWVSNTATALMMLPIGLSVLDLVERRTSGTEKLNFEIVLVLCIAYACNIGGMATIIGTPPNALLVGYMSENYGVEISFLQWLTVGLPLVAVALPVMYFVLTKVVYPIHLEELPGGREFITSELRDLGPITSAEKKVAAVFCVTALLWVTRPLLTGLLPGLSDTGIAIGAAVSLFIIPVDFKEGKFLLSWSDLTDLPWGVLILFGGGLSLASAINDTGLAGWIGQGVSGLQAWPMVLLVGAVILLVVFLTEMTSNTATTAAFLPILASVAVGIGENPLLFILPAALAASCAFMLPVATPPNAIVYGSGKISIPEMSKAGLWLNMIFIVLLTAFSFTLLSWFFGVEIGVLPEWVK
ncbi:DASS family sodium-coupled anion symporter [Aliifodinibius sp. S!AR15-10]|uniref:SLC13 family permease n=1 Tax=Aliifodinibius sp. S!AR15-10 TaxID=2950437 RepID=UPI00285518EA|nr:DASS family sodium-coupled anion symporter [Aliifodinibius sp. S!AR15-10]MDR8391899.1 DASS family sodium-coupled anion symporter [Aliifodinibius sp. S!AR15-10]